MAFKLAEAFVRLFTDSKDLKAGLANAKKETIAGTAAISAGLKNALRIAFPAGITLGIIAAGKASIDAADRMLELSQQTGLSTEQLSRLQYGASTAGLQIEQLNIGIRFLNRSLFEAQSGGAEAAAALKAVGVSAEDLAKKSPHEILLKIADTFSKNEQRGNKAALAMKIFGRAGAEMIPFLNEGRAGIERWGKAADKAGFTISTQFAQQADEFNDNIQGIKNQAMGLANRLTSVLLPAIKEIGSAFAELAPDDSEGGTDPWVQIKELANGIAAAFWLASASIRSVAVDLKHLGDLGSDESKAATDKVWKQFEDKMIEIFELNGAPQKIKPTTAAIDGLGAALEEVNEKLELGRSFSDIYAPIRESAEKTLELQTDIGIEILQSLGLTADAERAIAVKTFEERKALIMALVDVHGEKAGLILQNEQALKIKLLAIDKELLGNFINITERGLEDGIFNAIKGNTEGVKDAWRAMLDDMLRSVIRFMAQRAVTNFLEKIAGSQGGSGGGWMAVLASFFKGKGYAEGGVIPGGFQAFAAGGIVKNPTFGLVGEGKYNEAVIPLPDGNSVPVQLHRDTQASQPIMLTQRIQLSSDLIGAMRTSEDEIITTVTSDILRNGPIRRVLQLRR